MTNGDNFISLGMDYETFREHQKRETGIFKFMESLLKSLSREKQFKMTNPGEAVAQMKTQSKLSIAEPISWADHERDLSAWLGNDMQSYAFESLKKLFPLAAKSADMHLLWKYRYLQTSDHFYYMSTKKGSDGGVHHTSAHTARLTKLS